MLIFGLALLLTLAGILGFPCWRHSLGFGYGPSASAGVLLILLAALALGHKPDGVTIEGPTMAGSTTPKEPHDVKIATAPAIIKGLSVDPSRQPTPLHRDLSEAAPD